MATLVGASTAAADVSGPDIVSFLNTQRAANGITAGIVEDPALSDGCAKHNAYGRMNNVLSHGEDPSLRGYTPEGDQAGRTSVLYNGGGPWTPTSNPFETAPIHLHQLLAPRIDRMGAAENSGWGCATTLASRNRPAPPADVTYTYPGDGATGWPPAQTAYEGPYTPGEMVGIPAGTETGPYLYVMFDGPDLTPFDTATATGATVAGPDGPVAVAVVDNTTSGLQGYLPTGMEVIPRAPLRPNATYTASVSASVTTQGGSGAARAFARTWSFTTGPLPNAVQVVQSNASGSRLRVWVTSDAPGAAVTATGPGTSQTHLVAGDGSAQFDVDRPGTWSLCAQSGGGTTGYAAAQSCVNLVATSSAGTEPVMRPTANDEDPTSGAPRRPGSRPYGLSIRSRRGRRVSLKLRLDRRANVRWRISAGRRTLTSDRRSGLAAGTWTWTLRLPGPRRAVRLAITVIAGGRSYTATRRFQLR